MSTGVIVPAPDSIQLLIKVWKANGRPGSASYALVELDAERLSQLMGRMEHICERLEDDCDLLETKHFCNWVRYFEPSTKKLRTRIERITENADHVFLYSDLIHIPMRSLVTLENSYMIVGHEEAGFAAVTKTGEMLESNLLPYELYEVAQDVVEEREQAKAPTTKEELKPEAETEVSPSYSYFS